MVAVAALGQQPAGSQTREFLSLFARTNRFRLGDPGAFSITPDGELVLFLRSQGPESFVQDLWAFDVSTSRERLILTGADLIGKGDEKLSAEELARRERMRMSSRGITSFELSRDGKTLLVPLSGKLFRVPVASFERGGKAQVHEIATGGAAIDPRLSPDGARVAFVRDGALWVSPTMGGEPRRVSPEAVDETTYGEAEFAAQEEMKRMHGFWWSPDSRRLAYQRTDSSGLETFYIPDPADPARKPQPWRYPRTGKNNAIVSLFISPDILGEGAPIEVKWDSAQFPYLARVSWPRSGAMTILVQNREQTEQVLSEVNPATGSLRPLLTETDRCWIELEHDSPDWIAEGRRFVWLSQQGDFDGWELQVRGADGAVQKRIAPPGWQLAQLVCVDDRGDVAVVTASPAGDSAQLQVLRVDLKTGAAQCLTASADRSGGSDAGGVFGIKANEKLTTWVISGRRRDGSGVVEVWKGKPGMEEGVRVGEIRSVAAPLPFAPQAQWVTVQAGGRDYPAVIIRPRDMQAGKKYPVIDFVYGGPTANMVNANARSYALNQWFADQGFIVVSIDGRGTPRRGAKWSRVYKESGAGNLIDAPLSDQCEALIALCARFPEMDRDRIGVFGWSFGGYFSSMAAMRRPDVFKAAVAGAPVTDFRDYDTHYTERYLGLPDVNRKGYEASDVLTYCKDLSVPLLVVQGTADDNVYFVHSLKLTDRLFREGKPFEFVPLAGQTHMVTRPEMVERLYERVADFFQRTLGKPRNR